MTDQRTTYRWNTSAAAEAFDVAAEFIHPFYLEIQDQLLSQLALGSDEPSLIVDLGGGSGRLVERVLERFPKASAVLVDQSEPFLALAERRLRPFGLRAGLIKQRLQDDWRADLPGAPQAIVSMSAIHHLDPAEKRALHQRCFGALAPSGLLVQGDEYRPETDAEYLALLEWWAADMDSALQSGLVPASFRPVFERWYDRNIRRFGEPKQSGDDFLETIAAQALSLREAGFADVRTVWQSKLWAVLVAVKPR